MTSYLSKILGGILAIFLLIFVPLICQISINEIGYTRMSWNALENYIDIVADKGLLTTDDYENFVLNLSAGGVVYDITIEISRKTVLPDGDNTARVIYQPVGYYSSTPGEEYQILSQTKTLRQGDIITVKCRAINKTFGQTMLYRLTGMDGNNNIFSLSNMVRNDG